MMSHDRRTALTILKPHTLSSICRCSIVLSFLLALLSAAPTWAQDWRFSLSTFVNYSRGDYGTTQDTTLVYVPFTLRAKPIEGLTLGLTVPYIRQTTQNIVVTGGGVAVRKGVTTAQTEDGLGDLLLKGEYVLLKEQPSIPEITASLKIKFPTADEDKGLGTGEFDETIGVSFSKTFAQRLVAYLDFAYTFIGSPPGTNFNNTFSWSVGTAYLVAQPLTLFGFLDGATAISPGRDNPLEFRFGAEYKVVQAVRLTGSVSVGLSDGSPDYGVSGGLAWRF